MQCPLHYLADSYRLMMEHLRWVTRLVPKIGGPSALVTCCLHLSKPNQQMHRLICLLWGSSGFDRNSNRAKIFSIGANLALNRFWMTLNSSLWVNDDFTTSCGFRNHCNIFKCASHSLVGRMAYSRPIDGCRQSKASTDLLRSRFKDVTKI